MIPLYILCSILGISSSQAQDFGTGSVSAVAPVEAAPVGARLGLWTSVPGLSTGVASAPGDNLEIAVCAEMYQPEGAVWFRALVDGKAAQPSDVQFKAGSEDFDGIRSFTFVQPNVSVGQHLVEIQWFTRSTASIRDRTLTVHSGSPGNGPNRLAVAAAPSGPDVVKGTPVFEDIPGLATSITTVTINTLALVFSAEGGADSGRMMVRALVNGARVGEVVFSEAGNGGRQGTRSYTFIQAAIGPGVHRVTLQWAAEGGVSRIGDRTVAVSAIATSSQQTNNSASQTTMPQTSWVDIPMGSTVFHAVDPVNTAAFSLSGEVMADPGRLFLRALVDGQPASPGDVTLIQGGPKWRATSHVFILKNLTAGAHEVRFQARADPQTRAQIRNTSLRALWTRRSGSDFVQPFDGMAPVRRSFRTLVVCFDPMRPEHVRPSFAQVRAVFEGSRGPVIGRMSETSPSATDAGPIDAGPFDAGPNVRAWFAENSAGTTALGQVRYTGCADGNWYLAPAAHRGNWYWDNEAFEQMWKDALQAADADVDFHAYDTDHNNSLSADELLVAIVRPQNNPYGTLRGTSTPVDGNPASMNFRILDLYFSSVPGNQLWNVGTISHESSHAVLGARDLYGSCAMISSGYYSIMDQHSKSTHLDPFHKMKNGLVQPVAVDLSQTPSAILAVPAVELRHQVFLLYHPDRVNREYFLVENRFPGTALGRNYDGPLGTGAVVVWQIFEDKNLTATSAVCPGDPRFIRLRSVLSVAGRSVDLKWADGSSAGVRLTATIANADLAEVSLTPIR
jgi:M6 family metalloprotease-like protein